MDVYHYVGLRTEGYSFDKAGNRLSKDINYIGNVTPENSSYTYYPKTNRLLTDGKYAYQYDANGNMTRKGTVLNIEGTDTAVSDVTDWSAVTGSTAGSVGSITFAAAGEQWQYGYDLLNRLVEVTKDGTLKASYTYNAAGLRIKKESGERTKYYTFDLSGNVLYEEDQDGAYRKYVYIKNTRFAREDGSTDGSAEVKRYYYHTDHLGSTVMVTDEAGEVVWDAEYTPFGDLNDPYKAEEGMVQFTGKDMDFDTGLYYYNARWYDKDLGRFITEDPIRDGLNWYAYANNNPLRFVDPTGLESADAAFSRAEALNTFNATVYNKENPLNQKEFDAYFGFGNGKSSQSCQTAAIVNSYDGITQGALAKTVDSAKQNNWLADDGSPKAINSFSKELATQEGLSSYKSLVYDDENGYQTKKMTVEDALSSDYDEGIVTLEKEGFTHYVAGFNENGQGEIVDSLDPNRSGATDYTATEVKPLQDISLPQTTSRNIPME